ncbi:MAG: HDOD domain-containing protein [Gallionella sp.]
MDQSRGLEYWVSLLTRADLPVLKQTARELAELRNDDKKLNAHVIAEVISRDPIMTVKLLRYLQQHKKRIQTAEVVQVEQALLMLGVEPFYNNVSPKVIAQEILGKQIVALTSLLQVVHRAHRASEYAKDWAVRLHDLRFEEVRIAALLHNIAEILMWCFAPEQMMQIRDMQQKDSTLRSQTAQESVFGFGLSELQKTLVENWGLPNLLLTLIHDTNSKQSRVRNVLLAVRLARHSAHGWNNAALPDDFTDIGDLLHIPPQQVMDLFAAEAFAKKH